MKEMDIVELLSDFKDLKQGTKGTIVLKYSDKDFEVEFFDEDNNTIGVYTISIDRIKKV